MKPLDPAVRTIWTIRYALWTAALTVAGAFYDVTGLISSADRIIPPGGATLTALLGGILLTLLVPRLQYRYWRYDVRDEELYLERGVLNHVKTVVPLRRIQHLDVSQNVLEREFDLGKLIVHTAGTRASTVVLPGLRIEVANHLYDEVKQFVAEDAL